MTIPKLRVARSTDNLAALLPFYRDGLGFDVLFRFEAHAGIDGLMLGHAGAPYHFEFTQAERHRSGSARKQDDLLVFYIPEPEAWHAAIDRMTNAGFAPVPAANPY